MSGDGNDVGRGPFFRKDISFSSIVYKNYHHAFVENTCQTYRNIKYVKITCLDTEYLDSGEMLLMPN